MIDDRNETRDTLNDITARIDDFWRESQPVVIPPGDERTEVLRPKSRLSVRRYEMGAVIGEGGMGQVMLARDRALERPVAVKMLTAGDDDNRKKLTREAGIAGRLEHPNIVPLYDAGVDGEGRPYLAMRYVEGETLRSVIEKLRNNDVDTMKRFSLEARCRIVLQLLSALELAHARRVLHRDIKPDNVMIGPFGEVLLVDWGIACSPEESAADADQHIGTLRYMSPEQVNAEPLDERSDIYALSVLLYELLTLEHPLGATPPAEAARMLAITQKIPTPAELVRTPGHPVVPRALSLVVMKGLEKSRDARWPSATSMQRAIEQVLAGDAPIVCPHTAYARGLTSIGRVLDRFPRLTYAATFLILALAAVGAFNVVTTAIETAPALFE